MFWLQSTELMMHTFGFQFLSTLGEKAFLFEGVRAHRQVIHEGGPNPVPGPSMEIPVERVHRKPLKGSGSPVAPLGPASRSLFVRLKIYDTRCVLLRV
jgi:hypothetical protein